MLVWVAQKVPKWTVRGAPVCHDGNLVSVACHLMPSAAQRPATCLWESPRVTHGVGELEHRHEVVTCRGEWLAAGGVLPRLGTCRSPGLAGTRGASRGASLRCLGWPSRQASLAGVLVLQLVVPASSSCRGLASSARQAPLAGASSSWLEYFVLVRPREGPWRFLAFPWQALPRGAATVRAQVRGTKVPLL